MAGQETIFEGVARIWFVPSINTKASPTVAEIIAGVDLTPWVIDIDRPKPGKVADSADVSSGFDKTVPGSFGGGELTLLIKRKTSALGNDTGDTAYKTLPRLTAGNIVVAPFGFSGAAFAPVAGDHCETWPINVISRSPVKNSRNAIQKADIKCAIPADPEDEATVAA